MAGVAVVLFGGDGGELERRGAGHVRIDEQDGVAPSEVGDMLDLQLVILDHFDLVGQTGSLELAHQQRREGIIAA